MPSLLIRISCFVAVFLVAQVTGRSQGIPRAVPVSPGYSSQSADPPQERMQVVDPDKKLSANDQVTIEIVEDREGGLPRVVTAAGAIDVPPIGRVQVAGKTTTAAAADIKRRLEADFYYHATVKLNIDRVSPVEVETGSVNIAGEVRVPGPQKMLAREPLTLSVAIQKAGNFTEWANKKKVKVTRQVNGATQTSEYNVKKIIEDGNSKADPILQDGDRVFIPKAFARI